MAIKKVGVVGCGLMGGGIAQVTAEAGYPVVVREVAQPLLDKGLGAIKKNLDRNVEKARMAAEARDKVLANLKGTTSLEDLKDCDLIIEAIVENIEEKKNLFAALDALCPPHAILASNTSSCTVIEMAAATKRMDRVVGLHFFNPVPMMKLVEVVRTIQTGEATFRAAWDFAKSVGKEPVAAKDTTGFVVNLLLVPYLLDAIRALERGVASVEDMDKAMKLGCGYPMGPFTLLDFVGLDTTLYIGDIMFAEFRDARYAPPPLLRRMVLAGMHGRKSGKGFYDYSGPEPKPADLGL
jgi:3-hydroxybutyryl-CoA dehydrogenase